MRVIEATINLV